MILKHSKISLLLICALVLYGSCNKKTATLHQYGNFISDTENGYKISKSVNDVLVSVIYLPPEYISLKQMKNLDFKNQLQYDSLLAINKCSPTFIMVFAPDETRGNKNDIMYDGISNFKEYTQRALTLNFDLEKNVKLLINEQNYTPVLTSLENTYGLTKDRKVNIVFAPKHYKNEFEQATAFDFVYTDEIFGVGTLHFYFDKKNLAVIIPEIATF
jgi:hypothetical protein